MKKVIIFWGPDASFKELLPNTYKSLTDLAIQLDRDAKTFEVNIPKPDNDASVKKGKQKVHCQTFVAGANEYCSVNEHIITNFSNFLSQFSCQEMYIQNPPRILAEQLFRIYGILVKNQYYQYQSVSKQTIHKINKEFDSEIIGQEGVKNQLLKALFPAIDGKQKKPVTILFYGPSGVGKTESAKYLASLLGGEVFRKQFSMFQGGEFANYLFGGKYNEKSFAQDLLSRKSNVILLDEFDKANPIFHSAFYQLFDDGIYEDTNYKAILDNAVIVCTSNYSSRREIEEALGSPIFNRFDAIIQFEHLSADAKVKITESEIQKCEKLFPEISLQAGICDNLIRRSTELDNARAIQRLVRETFSLIGIRKICDEEECDLEMTKGELKKKTVDYLLTQPAGMRLTMMDAVTEACSGENVDSSLLTYSLLDDIIEGAEEKGLVLDYGSHDELGNKPFAVDFVVRNKH